MISFQFNFISTRNILKLQGLASCITTGFKSVSRTVFFVSLIEEDIARSTLKKFNNIGIAVPRKVAIEKVIIIEVPE